MDEYVIGSDGGCDHPEDYVDYLGHNGAVAFYQCGRCEAVIVRSPERCETDPTRSTDAPPS